MNLYDKLNENQQLDKFHKLFHKLSIDYDNAVYDYTSNLQNYNKDFEELSIDSIIEDAELSNIIKDRLQNLITKLNALQVIFEQVGLTSTNSTPEDVDENIFVNQLEKFSEQCMLLDENFDTLTFTSFFTDLSYLTSLAEIHFNRRFGELNENIIVTENTEDVLEETEEVLEELPEPEIRDLK